MKFNEINISRGFLHVIKEDIKIDIGKISRLEVDGYVLLPSPEGGLDMHRDNEKHPISSNYIAKEMKITFPFESKDKTITINLTVKE